MPHDEGVSESGQPIYRHRPRERGLEPTHGDPSLIEKVDRHIERHLGKVSSVYHELVSDIVHVDVHHVPPDRKRNHHLLVTSGMAEKPMLTSEGAEDWRFAELMLALPGTWPLQQEAFKDENHYWPIRLLKILARFPHEYDTWLGWGHTVPNGDPPKPFAPSTGLCCALLLEPTLAPEDFGVLEVDSDRRVFFYGLFPIYEDEMNFKLKRGAEALQERFQKAGITELIDPRRPSVCRKRFGFF
jgi:hypothetical protein